MTKEERVALQKALQDIAAVYPPFDSDERTAKTGQEFLLRVIEEIGIENALTPSAIILLGSMNRESQGY